MNLEPFGSHLIVEPLPKEEVIGKIIVPASVQETHAKARVVAVGKGYRRNDGSFDPLVVKEGDVVMYSKHSGTKIVYKAKDYTILTENDLWAKVL